MNTNASYLATDNLKESSSTGLVLDTISGTVEPLDGQMSKITTYKLGECAIDNSVSNATSDSIESHDGQKVANIATDKLGECTNHDSAPDVRSNSVESHDKQKTSDIASDKLEECAIKDSISDATSDSIEYHDCQKSDITTDKLEENVIQESVPDARSDSVESHDSQKNSNITTDKLGECTFENVCKDSHDDHSSQNPRNSTMKPIHMLQKRGSKVIQEDEIQHSDFNICDENIDIDLFERNRNQVEDANSPTDQHVNVADCIEKGDLDTPDSANSIEQGKPENPNPAFKMHAGSNTANLDEAASSIKSIAHSSDKVTDSYKKPIESVIVIDKSHIGLLKEETVKSSDDCNKETVKCTLYSSLTTGGILLENSERNAITEKHSDWRFIEEISESRNSDVQPSVEEFKISSFDKSSDCTNKKKSSDHSAAERNSDCSNGKKSSDCKSVEQNHGSISVKVTCEYSPINKSFDHLVTENSTDIRSTENSQNCLSIENDLDCILLGVSSKSAIVDKMSDAKTSESGTSFIIADKNPDIQNLHKSSPVELDQTLSEGLKETFQDKKETVSAKNMAESLKSVEQSADFQQCIVNKEKTTTNSSMRKKPGCKLTSLLKRLPITKEKNVLSTPVEHTSAFESGAVKVSSSDKSTGFPQCDRLLTPHTSKKRRRTTDSSTVSLPKKSSQKSFSVFSLLPQTDSLNEDLSGVKVFTKPISKNRISVKIIKSSKVKQDGSLNVRNVQAEQTVQHNKMAATVSQPSPRVIRVSRVLCDKTHSSPEPTSVVMTTATTQPVLIPADSGKYVQGFLAGQSLKNKPAAGDRSHDPDIKSAKVQSIPAMSKIQLSLLNAKNVVLTQNKHSSSNVRKSPTVYSLLASARASSAKGTQPVSNQLQKSKETGAPSTVSNFIPAVVAFDTTKAPSISSLGSNKLILTSGYQLTNTGQIIFQPIAPAKAPSSDNIISVLPAPAVKPMVSEITVSKSSSTGSIMPSTTSKIIVMPKGQLIAPGATILALSTMANSKSNAPAGIFTFSNINAISQQVLTAKTTTVSKLQSKLSDNVKISQNELAGQTKLVTNKTSSDTSVNSQRTKVFNLAESQNVVIPIGQGNTQPIASTQDTSNHPLKFIVAGYPTLYTLPKCMNAQAGKDLSQAIYTVATPEARVSTKNTKCIPEKSILRLPITDKIRKKRQTGASCPQPIDTKASVSVATLPIKHLPQSLKLVPPATSKAISLLSMPLQSSLPVADLSGQVGTVAEVYTQRKRKRKLKIDGCFLSAAPEQIIKQNPQQKLSSWRPKWASASAKTDVSKEFKVRGPRSVTMRTGQGPAMVIVPDLGDDSSDAGSETNLQASTFLKQLLKSCQDMSSAISSVSDSSSETPSKVLGSSNLSCSDSSSADVTCNVSDRPNSKGSYSVNTKLADSSTAVNTPVSAKIEMEKAGNVMLSAVLNTEVSERKYPHVPVNSDVNSVPATSGPTTMATTSSFEDEETDSEVEEEQDISVLQQLLTHATSDGLPVDQTNECNQLLDKTSTQQEKDIDINNMRLPIGYETIENTNLVHRSSSHGVIKNKAIEQVVVPKQSRSTLLKQASPGISGFNGQVVRERMGKTELCDLKIESVFSLSGNPDDQDMEFQTNDSMLSKLTAVTQEHAQVFNIRDSEDWKNAVSPCFVVLERLCASEIPSVKSTQSPSQCSKHCRKRTLDYLCNLRLLTCVNHPDPFVIMKPKKIKPGPKANLRKMLKHEFEVKNCPGINTPGESFTSHPVLIRRLTTDLSCELATKPLVDVLLPSQTSGDTTQFLAVSNTELQQGKEVILSNKDDLSTEDKISPAPEVGISSPEPEFHEGLKLLQKQILKKREKMLRQKMSRKSKDKSPKSKSKSQKLKDKSPLKSKNKSTAKRKTKEGKVALSNRKCTEIKGIQTKEHQVESGSNTNSCSLPKSDKSNSCMNSPRKRILKPKYHSTFRIKQAEKVKISAESQSPSKGSDLNSVNQNSIGTVFQASTPQLVSNPADKIKAALLSLRSYLAATGKKPTEGNAQFFILKKDDQHYLIKLPQAFDPATDQNKLTACVNAVSVFSSAAGKTSQNVAGNGQHKPISHKGITYRIKKSDINNFPVSSIADSASTPAESTKMANPVAKTHTGTVQINSNVAKILPKTQVPASTSKFVTNVEISSPETSSQGSKGSVKSHRNVISLLRQDLLASPQQHTSFATTPITEMTGVSSSAVLARIQPRTSVSSPQKLGFSLSRLPPNSSMLPQRRTASFVLSEEERRVKRRKLEAKYPLPPGVIIKFEPDDSEYEISSGQSDTAQAYSPITRSLPSTPRAHPRGLLQLTNPSHSAEQLRPSWGCDNEADISEEPDGPPALIDETTADDTSQDIPEDETVDSPEEMPPVLQPMFISSAADSDKDLENTGLPSFHAKRSCQNNVNLSFTTSSPSRVTPSTSAISLCSESSMDSGVDTGVPSASGSYTSLTSRSRLVPETAGYKNLKIQHLKELLKKKEMEIENMKKMRSEFPSIDLDSV